MLPAVKGGARMILIREFLHASDFDVDEQVACLHVGASIDDLAECEAVRNPRSIVQRACQLQEGSVRCRLGKLRA